MKFPLPLQGFHFSFSLDGRYRWIFFVFVVLVVRRRRLSATGAGTTSAVDGIPISSAPSRGWKYPPLGRTTSTSFPEDTTQWKGDTPREEGQQIYVYISRDTSGLMEIQGASAAKPFVGGDYMQATVVSYQDGFVQFQVGFDRYRMAPELTDGIYNLQPR